MTKRLAPGSRSITRESDVASLVMAGLKRTDLTGATVIDADLRGALLEGTKLANANIIGARIRKRHVNDYVQISASVEPGRLPVRPSRALSPAARRLQRRRHS